MLKIQLLCAAGVSTSLLMAKMKEQAALNGEEVEISACPSRKSKKTSWVRMWP